jgi:hypothetical protein
MYIDAGGIDKHIEMPTLLTVIGDTAHQLRSEFADSMAYLKSLIGGEGIWAASGNYVTTDNSADSVGIGGMATEKFEVFGKAKAYKFISDTFDFNGNASIYRSGSELYLFSNMVGPFSLSQLAPTWSLNSLGYSPYNFTYAPYAGATPNVLIGATGTTLYKLDVRGLTQLYGNTYQFGDLFFNGIGGYTYNKIYSRGDTMYFSDKQGTYTLKQLADTGKGGSGTGSVDFSSYANGYYQWLGIDPTGNVFADSLTSEMNFNYDAESTDDYVITLTGVTSYYAGMVVYFVANTANTGACTLDINDMGQISLKAFHDQDPPNNYIEVGSIVQCVFDGTNFQLLEPDSNP